MSKLPLLRARWSPGATSAALRLHALLFLAAGFSVASAQTDMLTTLADDAHYGRVAGVLTTPAGSAGSDSPNADFTVVSAQTFTFSTLAYVFGDGTGVAVDASGNMYVADQANGLIHKVTADGVVTILAGGSFWYYADGTGSAAGFSFPQGVAVDGSGNVFVADSSNCSIRKITPAGVVTTLAGTTRPWAAVPDDTIGSADGAGSAARFSFPAGVAVDGNGNVFVADTGNHTIRKITAGGVVTTLAGLAGNYGSNDGTGEVARFRAPYGVAVDRSGNVFVADTNNCTIRKISAGGIVTTLAGLAGNYGSNDGTGDVARFNAPYDLAVDGSGNVFVADTYNHGNGMFRYETYNHTIRKITADGVVTTLANSGGSRGSEPGTGNVARFAAPLGVTVDNQGNLLVSDSGTIRKGVLAAIAPVAVTAPQPQHANLGAGVSFTVATADSAVSYQWKKDGVAIAGATSSNYQIASAAAGDMGFYSLAVTGAAGTVESPVVILTVATGGSSRLGNFSARGFVPAGGDLTTGFVLRGSGSKSVLVRAVGPTLGSHGVGGALADPKVDIFPAGASVATNTNDDWGGGLVLAGAFASIGAFPLPAASKDAALLGTLAVAGYTARIASSVAGGSGIALAEVYDRDPAIAPSRVVNISTLGFVGTGAPALVLGFVIEGAAPKRLLIRAVGPGLVPLGVAGVLGDPQLSIIPLGKTFAVASTDTWGDDAALTSAFVAANAFALPASSKDAAVVVRLPPGGYTVTVSGVPDSTGRALVEIYDLDP